MFSRIVYQQGTYLSLPKVLLADMSEVFRRDDSVPIPVTQVEYQLQMLYGAIPLLHWVWTCGTSIQNDFSAQFTYACGWLAQHNTTAVGIDTTAM